MQKNDDWNKELMQIQKKIEEQQRKLDMRKQSLEVLIMEEKNKDDKKKRKKSAGNTEGERNDDTLVSRMCAHPSNAHFIPTLYLAGHQKATHRRTMSHWIR